MGPDDAEHEAWMIEESTADDLRRAVDLQMRAERQARQAHYNSDGTHNDDTGAPSAATFGRSSVQVQGGGESEPVVGPGVIHRLNDHHISVDGVRYAANEAQEERVRSLTPAQRRKFHEAMGFPGTEVPDTWYVYSSTAKGDPKEIRIGELPESLSVIRVNTCRREYKCDAGNCSNVIIEQGSGYVWIRDLNEAGTDWKYHAACAPDTMAEGIALLYPEGVPPVPETLAPPLDITVPDDGVRRSRTVTTLPGGVRVVARGDGKFVVTSPDGSTTSTHSGPLSASFAASELSKRIGIEHNNNNKFNFTVEHSNNGLKMNPNGGRVTGGRFNF